MSDKTNATIKHPGMGAIPHAKGVTFRVWAPHADKVYVTGTFNSWSKTARDGYAIGFPRAGLWKTRFNSDFYNYGPDFANHATSDVDAHGQGTAGLPCSGKISIGPYTVVIFSQDE